MHGIDIVYIQAFFLKNFFPCLCRVCESRWDLPIVFLFSRQSNHEYIKNSLDLNRRQEPICSFPRQKSLIITLQPGMRDRDYLARDVYLYLNDKWNVRIFKNIAASEQTHIDAIKTLLDTYTIPDPAAGKGIGEFTNPDLQKLYDDLIREGSISKVEALRVGVIIEETDIDDLTEGIATTRHNDIKTVYSNLLQGSLNHLDAFESTLAK